jgi:hypothetical protein
MEKGKNEEIHNKWSKMLEVKWDDVNVEGIWCKECNILLAETEMYRRKRGFALGAMTC